MERYQVVEHKDGSSIHFCTASAVLADSSPVEDIYNILYEGSYDECKALYKAKTGLMTISESEEPIHLWFELSYAQYLTIPRSVLQSMPVEWQRRFVECLEELDEFIDWRPDNGRYSVQLKDERGRYIHDPLMDYERGRKRVPLKQPK
jgi:hypothetical protein